MYIIVYLTHKIMKVQKKARIREALDRFFKQEDINKLASNNNIENRSIKRN